MRLHMGSNTYGLRAAAALCLTAFAIHASELPLTPVGHWRTVDDKTGKPRSIVAIYEQNGRLFGRIESSLNPQNAGRRCDRCKDDRKDKPIVGMVIVRGLAKDGDEYNGGDILDPDNGVVYRCKVRLMEGGGKLSVRGYVGISLFGRSQVWSREP
jgi:uncharacterized protein (DUF2147 family)